MKTIAVVEDNADNRLLLEAMLGHAYRLTEYETGPEALAGIRQAPPDLVLLDISLPGMDGTEVLSYLRMDAALAGLPIVALTAHAMRGDRDMFLAMGFDDYLTKPIMDEALLLDSITRLLDRIPA